MNLSSMLKKNAIVLIWTTSCKMAESVRLIDHWGLEYVTILIVWTKIYKNGQP